MNTEDYTAQTRLPTGMLIDGRYRIKDVLGEGGFALVYRAEHIGLERDIALKVLDLDGSPKDMALFRERFQREAKIAARLEHNHVVRIYDHGFVEETKQPFMAMELLRGHDLERELKVNGALEPIRALNLFHGVLDALAMAHEQNIIHKDLKPSNLYLVDPGTPTERLVILDYGIARIGEDEGARLTQTNQFSGTPAYLAPEYIEGQHVSPALDVYQMGLILVETLTNAQVVRANSTMGYLMAHCAGEQTIDAALDRTHLGQILRAAMCVDPSMRIPHARALQHALHAIDLTGVPNYRGQAPTVLPPSSSAPHLPSVPNTGQHPAPVSPASWQGPRPGSAPSFGALEPAAAHGGRDTGPLLVVAGVVLMMCVLVSGAGIGVFLMTGDSEAGPPAPTVETTEATLDPPLVVPTPTKVGNPSMLSTGMSPVDRKMKQAFTAISTSHALASTYLYLMPYGIETMGWSKYAHLKGFMPQQTSMVYNLARPHLMQAQEPPKNKDLDPKFAAIDKLLQEIDVHFVALEDYWHNDEIWREDRGAGGKKLHKKSLALREPFGKIKSDIDLLLIQRSSELLTVRLKQIDPKVWPVRHEIVTTMLLFHGVMAQLETPRTPEMRKALKSYRDKVRSARKVLRKERAQTNSAGISPSLLFMPLEELSTASKDYVRDARILDEKLAASNIGPEAYRKDVEELKTSIRSTYYSAMINYYSVRHLWN